jgi:predicted Zn-dependent peptidase
LEQTHLVIGANGSPARSEDRYKHLLMNIVLGGNMSSRLFQEVREKRGLAYSIYSYLASYIDCGYTGVYVGVEPETSSQVVEVIAHEINRLCQEPVSAGEIADAKDYAKAGLFLAADNMEARMMRLARNEFCYGRNVTMAEVAQAIDRITPTDLLTQAREIFLKRPLSAVALGPLTEGDIDWQPLDW